MIEAGWKAKSTIETAVPSWAWALLGPIPIASVATRSVTSDTMTTHRRPRICAIVFLPSLYQRTRPPLRQPTTSLPVLSTPTLPQMADMEREKVALEGGEEGDDGDGRVED